MTSPFDPSSIAVIGASADLDRISGLPIKYLLKHGYDGAIYPVNPNHQEVGGLTCYPSIEEVPVVPALAVVVLPSRLVTEVVADCFAAGVETVLVVSSGFSETGTETGIAAEAELQRLAVAHDAHLIGPNSQGIVDFHTGLAASFTPALARDRLEAGDVSFVTQSGAFGGAMTTLLQECGVGLNRWVATGNEADRTALDFVEGFAADDRTALVVGYVEAFEDGRKLVELKRTEAGIDLPIVLLKVGSSERGRDAAASHTGKIAGRHEVYEAIFREIGVMTARDIDEVTDLARTFGRLDTLPGPRLGVVTTSGGAGVHIADVADEERLVLPSLSDETRADLETHIPNYGSALNPVDITGQVLNDPDALEACFEALLADQGIDTVLVQLTNVGGERAATFAERLAAGASTTEKGVPVFVCWTGGIEKESALETYRDAGIPVFENPARCVRAIAHVVRFARSRPLLRAARTLPARLDDDSSDRASDETDTTTTNTTSTSTDAAKTAADDLTDNEADGRSSTELTEVGGKELLAEYGVAVPDEEVVTTVDEARSVADRIGYPVVAKLVAPEVHHRSHIGGVRTDLDDSTALSSACERLFALGDALDATVSGVSIQEQVDDGIEVSLGLTDSDFGLVLMFGRGGVDIERASDVTFRTIPVTRGQARAMLDEVDDIDRASLTPMQTDELIDAITALSDLFLDNRWIREADVNPLIVNDAGVTAVDALFVGSQ